MLVRITKREARQRFAANLHIVLCPCKLRPGFPFATGATIFGKAYLEQADWYGERDSKLWKGTREATAWDLMYNNWAYYNATHETGYYAHYYKEDGK